MRRRLLLAALAPLAACAHAGSSAPEPPIVAEPANGRARLYAACLSEAARSDRYDRYGRYLRMTCAGPPAEALFEAMGAFARTRGHVSVQDGVETRGLTSTTVNDRCRRDASGETSCLIVVPVGPFMDPANDLVSAKDKGG